MRVARLEEQFAGITALLRGVDDRLRKIEVDGAEIKGRLSSLSNVDERLRRIEAEASEIKGRLSNLPTTWAMIATVIGGQVALAGLLLGAFKLSGAH